MEILEKAKQNYELAFHLNANLEAGRVVEMKEEFEKTIVAHGGTVTFSKDPEKTRLSYPIRHERASYFGFINFSTSKTEGIAAIDEHIKLMPDIVRYIILKLESDEQREKAAAKTAAAKEKQEKRSKKNAAAPKSTNPLDKKLEEIIENL